MSVGVMKGKRVASAAVLLVLGGVISAAAWVGGNHGLAVAMAVFYVVCSAAAYAWSGRSGDAADVMRARGDERQNLIDQRATAFAGAAVIAACLVGMAVDLARGGDGQPYAFLCFVAGVSYTAAFAWIRRRI